MFFKNEIKLFVSGLLSDKPKEMLPYWYDAAKVAYPLREVIVINDTKKAIGKKRSQTPTSFEIQIISSSYY
jgi:hypothetical protein